MEDTARKTSGVQSATGELYDPQDERGVQEGQNPKTVMQEVRKACKEGEPDCEIFLGQARRNALLAACRAFFLLDK